MLRPGTDAYAPTVTFWGVRGSLPVPGSETAAFGGNTSCLEIGLPSRDGDRVLIVDAGSGLRALGASRDWSGVKRVDILLTHLHHDHVIGLPFFRGMMTRGLDVHLWCGNLGGASVAAALAPMFSPPLFPIRLDQFPATLTFHDFSAGRMLDVGGQAVATTLLNHPSGSTAYRVDGPGGSLAIVTDVEHSPGNQDPGLIDFCRGADTLIYDSMLEECDFGRCEGWGHSTVPAGVALAAAAGVRRLVGFHHAPEHTDAVMADRERRLRESRPEGLMAREGMALVCGPAA